MKTQGSVLERCISTFLLLFVFSEFTGEALAHPIVHYWENRGHEQAGLFLEPRVSYLNTSSNFDFNSEKRPLLNSASVSQYYLDLNSAYGFTDDFFVFARASAISINVTNPLQRDLSASGFGDQLFGANYRLLTLRSGLGLRMQFDASIPAYKNANALTSGDAYLGDESVDLTTGAFVEAPLSFIAPDMSTEVGAAYLYRSKAYSAAVPFSIFIKSSASRAGFFYSLGVRGQISLKTDSTATSPFGLAQAVQESNRAAAGSALIEGINASWWVAQGNLAYRNASGVSYTLTGAIPLMATNAPAGLQLSLGICFNLSRSPLAAGDAYERNRRSSEKRKLSLPKGFASYDREAKVSSVNDQLYLVKIDQGSNDTIETGQTFDIFSESDLIARARVISVKDNEAALNVIEYYQDHWIETGFTARRLVQ